MRLSFADANDRQAPLVLDASARRYGQRPSAMLGVVDPWEALMIDAICADAGRAFQDATAKRLQRQSAKSPVPMPVPVLVVGGL